MSKLIKTNDGKVAYVPEDDWLVERIKRLEKSNAELLAAGDLLLRELMAASAHITPGMFAWQKAIARSKGQIQ